MSTGRSRGHRWGENGGKSVRFAHHATLIKKVRAMKDGIDIALLGDSITQGWGGGWDGASPKVIVLKIGVNNAPPGFANGAPGIELCIENFRQRCPTCRSSW